MFGSRVESLLHGVCFQASTTCRLSSWVCESLACDVLVYAAISIVEGWC